MAAGAGTFPGTGLILALRSPASNSMSSSQSSQGGVRLHIPVFVVGARPKEKYDKRDDVREDRYTHTSTLKAEVEPASTGHMVAARNKLNNNLDSHVELCSMGAKM